MLIDIPYDAVDGSWQLSVNHEAAGPFRSREQALAFAVGEAERCGLSADRVAINIEGADGRWRAFSPSMQPLPDRQS